MTTLSGFFKKSFVTLALLSTAACTAIHENAPAGLAQYSAGATCDDTELNAYTAQIYPFFRESNHCINCHIEGGPGLGTFASADPKISFAAFSAAGISTISYMATNPQHKPPYTGTQNQPEVDQLNANWTVIQKNYNACVSATLNGGVDESFLTSQKAASSIYADQTAVQTLTWDLDLASDVDSTTNRSLPVQVTIDVQLLVENNLAKGYIFSNPTLQLKDTTKAIVVEGLFFQINGNPISSQTTFTNLSRVITVPGVIPLMNVRANTLLSPISTTDRFQLYYRRLSLTSGVDTAPPPLTPILHVADPDTGSTTLLHNPQANVGILRDAGIVRWCLSESPVKPADTQAPCVNSITGPNVVNGWQLTRPMNYTFANPDGDKTLYLWVADQNLKINDTPAAASITLDTTPPAAPVINSITVSDSQVADMVVSHPNEADVTGWCVFEQNAIKAPPTTPGLDDICWTWTTLSVKPVTVGFKDSGARNVWVYVRDKAGNVSAPSNMMSATNTFGAITYSQLTGTAGGPRAIFHNRCLTCHGTPANPGYSAFQLFTFSEAVDRATSGVLVDRINNVISPMPNVNGGLMPQRERDLIKLWTTPEEGTDPLP